MSRIIAQHSHYIIEDVETIPKQLDYELGFWDKICYKLVVLGYQYDEDKKELRIPRGYSELSLRKLFPDHAFIVDKECYEFDKIDIQLTTGPRDYQQKHILTFMIGKEPYEYTKANSQTYVDLDTGMGKTYCGIATICYYKCRGVIMTPSTNSKIGDQWVDAAKSFTTLEDNEILLVKGSKMCEDIIKGKYKDIKIFIIPRSTVLSFVRKYNDNWKLLDKLIESMNVGIRVIDEAHLDFNTLVQIDCNVNCKRNFYMSSSPSRSQKDEKRIYKTVFYSVPKFGKELKTKEQNHIVPLIMQFKSFPTVKQLKRINTRFHGPSQALYGAYLLDEDGAREEFINAYIFAIHELFKLRRRSGKLLVLCITKEFAIDLAKVTNEIYPQYTTGLYIGSGKDKNKELDNDIVFSTPKGLGTGSELENHQFTINTITYASDVATDQMSGRLRKSDRPTIYCELVNIAHDVARKHYKEREKYLVKKAKNGKIIIHEFTDSDMLKLDKFLNAGFWYDGNGIKRTKDGYYVISPRKKL